MVTFKILWWLEGQNVEYIPKGHTDMHLWGIKHEEVYQFMNTAHLNAGKILMQQRCSVSSLLQHSLKSVQIFHKTEAKWTWPPRMSGYFFFLNSFQKNGTWIKQRKGAETLWSKAHVPNSRFKSFIVMCTVCFPVQLDSFFSVHNKGLKKEQHMKIRENRNLNNKNKKKGK